jgi:hypothetical protein
MSVKDKVLNILIEYDFEEIIYDNVNLDEYEVEAKPIATFIENNYKIMNGELLANNIQLVFLRHFGDLIDIQQCIWAAKDILFDIKEIGVI